MLLPHYKSCYKLNRLDKIALSAHNEPQIIVFDWKQMIIENQDFCQRSTWNDVMCETTHHLINKLCFVT